MPRLYHDCSCRFALSIGDGQDFSRHYVERCIFALTIFSKLPYTKFISLPHNQVMYFMFKYIIVAELLNFKVRMLFLGHLVHICVKDIRTIYSHIHSHGHSLSYTLVCVDTWNGWACICVKTGRQNSIQHVSREGEKNI